MRTVEPARCRCVRRPGAADRRIVCLALAGRARVNALPADRPGRAGTRPCLAYVDAESGCGLQRIAFHSGRVSFEDGRFHLTISRIVVSTWDSVVNGRRNWGIPKDRADFEVASGPGNGREDHIHVTSDGHEICDLRMATLPFAPPLPVRGALVPERFRTLAQRFDGRTYYYAPLARGRIRPGRLLAWRFDSSMFPDLASAAVVAVFKVESFQMAFPPARVA
jgi:hypothetical protein